MTTPSPQRATVMARSRALGHCICDPAQACPCETFKQQHCCPCAGERPPPSPNGPLRLTEWVHKAGCASKIPKRELARILGGLPEIDDPRVVLGRQAGDDAGVIMLDEARATVLTVDVFTPPVDDPYLFGRIAAANSVSDIYAMGATPDCALSIVGFPIHELPAEALHEILRGGIDALSECGVSVIGGHSLDDREIKCGFAVIGHAAPGQWLDHSGAQAGDVLVLTKPVGGGILAFAQQIGRARLADIDALAHAMAQLNKCAGAGLIPCGAHAATDVTGFSLLGHLSDLVRKSGVVATIDVDQVPVFPGVQELARQDVVPGGVERNREAIPAALLEASALTAAQLATLLAPETSGGLLVALPPERVNAYLQHLRGGGIEGHIIGTCSAGTPQIRCQTSRAHEWLAMPLSPLSTAATGGCCGGSEDPDHVCCGGVGGPDCCGGAAPADDHVSPGDPAPTPARACCGGHDNATTASTCCGGHQTATDTAACCGGADPAPSSCCGGAAEPADQGLPAPAQAAALGSYLGAVNAPGALDAASKALIGFALSVAERCEDCITIHAAQASAAGATQAQIAEAAALGIAFGGAAAARCYSRCQARS